MTDPVAEAIDYQTKAIKAQTKAIQDQTQVLESFIQHLIMMADEEQDDLSTLNSVMEVEE